VTDIKIRTLHLSGDLAAKHGSTFTWPATRIDLLLSGVGTTNPELITDIRNGSFYVTVGENVIEDIYELAMPFSDSELDIYLHHAIEGEISDKFGKIVIGAALIGAAVWTGGMSFAYASQVSTGLLQVGTAYTAQGVISMFTNIPQNDSEEADQSVFGSALNSSTEGGCVPVIFGKTRVQSTVVDLDISADEVLQDSDGIDIIDTKAEFMARILLVIGEGKIMGPQLNGQHTEASRKNVTYIKNVPASGIDSPDLKVHFRNGTATDNAKIVPGFTESSTLVAANIDDLPVNSWKTIQIPINVDEVKLNMVWPQGLFSFYKSYGQSTSGFEVQHRVNGGTWSLIADRTQKTQSLKPMQQTYRISAPDNTTTAWQIRIRRKGANTYNKIISVQDFVNSGGGNGVVYKNENRSFTDFPAHESTVSGRTHYNLFKLLNYNLIVGKVNRYVDSAFFALEIPSSSVEGVIGNIWFEVYGTEIDLPSHYNVNSTAENRFSGTYTGMSKKGWSDNPSLCILHFIRTQLSTVFPDELIDFGSFFEWAIFCDRFVSDGSGGTERNFTMNIQISKKDNPLKVINALMSCGLGKAIIDGGILRVIWDDSSDVDSIAIIDNDDVSADGFTYQSSNSVAQHTQTVAKYKNKNENYTTTGVLETHPSLSTRGVITNEIEAVAATSASQAHRVAKWASETANRNVNTVTWSGQLSHVNTRVGDIITIRDEFNRKNATVSDIDYKVTGIDIGNAGQYFFQAVEIDDSKRAAYELISVDPVSGQPSDLATGVRNVGPISDLIAVEGTQDRIDSRVLLVSWKAPDTNPSYIKHYLIRHRAVNGDVKLFTSLQERHTLELVDDGLHEITVTTISVTGNQSSPVTLNLVIDEPENTESVVDKPSNLRLTTGSGSTFTSKDLHVEWDAPSNALSDAGVLANYVVQFKKADASILKSFKTTNTSQSFSFDEHRAVTNGVPERNIIVNVVSVDTLGRSSGSVSRAFSNPAPAQLSNFQITSTHLNSVEFSFDASTELDVVTNKIRQASVPSMSGAKIVYDGKATQGSISGLKSGENFYFQVGAVDGYSDSVNWSSVESTTSVVDTGYVLEGFRVVIDDNNDLRIYGDTITFTDSDGSVTHTDFDSTANTPNSTWFDYNYTETGRRYYYFDSAIGSSGGLAVTSNFNDVYKEDNSRIPIAITESGNITSINGSSAMLVHQDMLAQRIIGAQHLQTDTAIITGTAQIQNAVITTANIASGDISKQEVITLYGDALSSSGATTDCDLYLYLPGHPNFSTPTWRYTPGGNNIDHDFNSSNETEFPHGRFWIPPVGDSETVKLQVQVEGLVFAKRKSGSNANIPYFPAMQLQWKKYYSPDGTHATASQINQNQTWNFGLSPNFSNVLFNRETEYSGGRYNGTFVIDCKEEDLVSIRLEKNPFNANDLVFNTHFEYLRFMNFRLIGTAILR